jgi:BirA family biotin operon repressor/biotin-[acetyl-CoA-carboxylase] ligase
VNGYTTSERFNTEALQNQLGTLYFARGNRLIYTPVVDSTNIRAMQLAQQGADEGLVVLADSQTAGKGRLGRLWLDRPGHYVLSSTILRPSFAPYFLVMIASLALVDTIADTCGVVATIKWPNDVLIEDRKVAGILIETSHDCNSRLVAVMGIGVNLNGQISEFVDTEGDSGESDAATRLLANATTLETACGHPLSRETFMATLLQYLEASYQALQQEQSQPSSAQQPTSRLIRDRWRNHLSTLGRTIEVRQGNTVLSGVAEDVDEHGELLLRSHSGARITVTWGDVGYPTN